MGLSAEEWEFKIVSMLRAFRVGSFSARARFFQMREFESNARRLMGNGIDLEGLPSRSLFSHGSLQFLWESKVRMI